MGLCQRSGALSINSDDGKHFELPCMYLRMFSRAAEILAKGVPEAGKKGVNIEERETRETRHPNPLSHSLIKTGYCALAARPT